MADSQLIRFGPFELDMRSHELRKNGVRLRLPDQAFQILQMLIERPGDVVLRRDIEQRLWPDGTVADVDQSINAVIRRLRTALGESAEQPRYLETLAKRGYRFLGEVERIEETRPAPAPVAVSLLSAAAAAVPAPEPPPAPQRFRRYVALGGGAAVALLAIAGAYGISYLSGSRPERPPTRMVPLTTFPGTTTYAAFSPDGEKVAFSWIGPPRNVNRYPLNIYVKPVGSGDPQQITSGATDDSLPHWSPDGSHIAFQRSTAVGHDLIVVPLGGGKERKIADMGIGLAWSPDGKEIAYVAPYPPHGDGGILVYSLASGKTRQLTYPKPYAEGLVEWSPDGKQIAFTRTMTQSAREVFVVPAKGGVPRRLTFDNQITEGFAWTPDSREIVFVSFRYGGPSIWRIPAGGGTPERIASMSHHPSYPATALRGNRLAFTESWGDSNVWQYERGGGGANRTGLFASPACLICSTVEDDSPRFSPDGRKIAFISRRTGSDEIWVCDSDGRYPIQLTSLGTIGNGSPRWSPDGHWIAFDSRSAGSPDIFVVSAQGGAARQLTTDPSVDIEPSWSHDGRWIYFTSIHAGQAQVWKAPFGGGPPVPVTRGVGAEAMESPDGKRLFYFRNDHHDGVWTVPVDGGPEEVVPELSAVKPTRVWTVREDGIYIYQDGVAGKPLIQFFNFATRRVTTVLEPEHTPLRTNPGLDISPDGRRLLYTQVDHRIEGLMMLENFR